MTPRFSGRGLSTAITILSAGYRPLGTCSRAAGWSAATLCFDPSETSAITVVLERALGSDLEACWHASGWEAWQLERRSGTASNSCGSRTAAKLWLAPRPTDRYHIQGIRCVAFASACEESDRKVLW